MSSSNNRHAEDVVFAAQKVDDDMDECMDHIVATNKERDELRPTPLNIATMTTMGHLVAEHINLIRVVHSFDDVEVKEFLHRRGVKRDAYSLVYPESLEPVQSSLLYTVPLTSAAASSRAAGAGAGAGGGGATATATAAAAAAHESTNKVKLKTFQNSVILKYADPVPGRNRKAVKIFCNGALHVTGCRKGREFLEVCDFVCDLLDLIFSTRTDQHRLQRMAVQLINTIFKVPHRFDLAVVYDLVTETYEKDAEYNVYFHPAVNIKLKTGDRCVTILVFHSGSVIITGVVCAAELSQAYDFITFFLQTHLEEVAVQMQEEQRELSCGDDDGDRDVVAADAAAGDGKPSGGGGTDDAMLLQMLEQEFMVDDETVPVGGAEGGDDDAPRETETAEATKRPKKRTRTTTGGGVDKFESKKTGGRGSGSKRGRGRGRARRLVIS